MITVHTEPDGATVEFEKLNTVMQLLNRMGRKSTRVLVIRDGELLTVDCRIRPRDTITIRDVISRG
ncbi:MAG TPA: hypothetical protein VJ934_10180 [Desulfomicrobiaceae bacterium]|nr:hypothetical protein [Desulfomicrobiaceae bacterium]